MTQKRGLKVGQAQVKLEAINHSTERVNGFLHDKDILSVRQFDRETLEHIYACNREMERIVKIEGSTDLCKGKVLANLFYEPSTRTSSSFAVAMLRLGGLAHSINEVIYSSVAKGENLPDTIKTLEQYIDVIVLRHPEKGSAAIAAETARKPIINAGDGIGEHPTQALLDIYTIEEKLHRLDGLKVAMMGDLKNGRTIHSLTRLLSLYGIEFYFVSPNLLKMPGEILEEATVARRPFYELQDVNEIIGKVDVLYVTRVQKERFEDPSQYEKLKDFYVVDPKLMSRAQKEMILMHPLPRIVEIDNQVDDDPRAVYFRQVENGMYVRMTLLAGVLGKLSC